MSVFVQGYVMENREEAKNHRYMEIKCPEVAATAQPGQFVQVRCGEGNLDPLLMRPISLHGIDRERGTITLLFNILGRGTEALAKRRALQPIDVLGPLGNGWQLSDNEGLHILVAGGIGIAPMLPLVEELQGQGKKVLVLYGGRSRDLLVGVAGFTFTKTPFRIATDDGSFGYHGFVTDLLKMALMETGKKAMVYVCGPHPMMAAVAKICHEAETPCQVSLEERMGCGVGACLSCVCKTPAKDSGAAVGKTAFGETYTYKKICGDGPVFMAEEVIWHG